MKRAIVMIFIFALCPVASATVFLKCEFARIEGYEEDGSILGTWKIGEGVVQKWITDKGWADNECKNSIAMRTTCLIEPDRYSWTTFLKLRDSEHFGWDYSINRRSGLFTARYRDMKIRYAKCEPINEPNLASPRM